MKPPCKRHELAGLAEECFCPEPAQDGASDASASEQPDRRSRGAEPRSATHPDPTCLHCLKRCGSMTELDIHLRFECEALGRKEGAGE